MPTYKNNGDVNTVFNNSMGKAVLPAQTQRKEPTLGNPLTFLQMKG